MEIFSLIILLLFFGTFLRKINVFPENTALVLNQYVIYVSLPALVLVTIPNLNFNASLITTALVPWIVLILSAAFLFVCARLLHWSNNTLGALLLIVPLGNTSFIGVPMVQAFFGVDQVAYALIYDQLGSFLALAIYGSLILAVFNKNEKINNKQGLAKTIGINIFFFPPFIALMLALIVCFVDLPLLYFELLTPIAKTLLPVVIIAVGFQLELKINRDKMLPFIMGLTIKMLIAPALVLLTFFLLDIKGVIYQVIVFESAMPPMISAGALAIMAGLSPKLTASMLAYGLLLSLLTLPLFHHLVKYFL